MYIYTYIYAYIINFGINFFLSFFPFFLLFQTKKESHFSTPLDSQRIISRWLQFIFRFFRRILVRFQSREARYRKIVINDSSKITIAYRGIYLHVLQDIAIPLLELNAGSIVVFWRIYVTKRNRINCGARQIGCVNFSRAFSRPRIVPWNFAGCKYSKGHFRRTFCFHETLK